MVINFVSSYLGGLGRVITDDKGIPITTIKSVPKKNFFFEYKKPVVIYDSCLTGKITNEPKIVIIRLSDLINFGFCVISVKGKFRKGQSTIYKLLKRIRPFPNNASICDKVPNEHSLQFDMSNNVVRLGGKNAGINGVGEWNQV